MGFWHSSNQPINKGKKTSSRRFHPLGGEGGRSFVREERKKERNGPFHLCTRLISIWKRRREGNVKITSLLRELANDCEHAIMWSSSSSVAAAGRYCHCATAKVRWTFYDSFPRHTKLDPRDTHTRHSYDFVYLAFELIATTSDTVIQVSIVARLVAIAIQVVARIALPVRLQISNKNTTIIDWLIKQHEKKTFNEVNDSLRERRTTWTTSSSHTNPSTQMRPLRIYYRLNNIWNSRQKATILKK